MERDTSLTRYCVDCEHHQKDGETEHLCFKDAEEIMDVVIGEKSCLNVHDCYDERTLQYDNRFCSVEGRHFKKKGTVVNAENIQQTNIPVTK